MASSSTTAAPWRSLFMEHLDGMKSPEFTLSTVRRVPASSSGPDSAGGRTPTGFRYEPRARTCIYRGMWAQLPVNPKNEAELNPDVFETEMPVFTTDQRMDKMAELWQVGFPSEEEMMGSGGGGPVEAVWWAEQAKFQWRVRGIAFVLAPDVESSEGGKLVQETLLQRTRHKAAQTSPGSAETDERAWSFGREITAHFGNLSPVMRGTFKNPPSGQATEVPVRDDRLGLGQSVTDLNDEVARANFRVVVIVPYQVDSTDLTDPKRGRRWQYRFVGEGARPEVEGAEVVGEWEKVEVWP